MEEMKSSKRRQLGDDVFRNWMSDPRVRAASVLGSAKNYRLRRSLMRGALCPLILRRSCIRSTKRAAATLRIVMLAS